MYNEKYLNTKDHNECKSRFHHGGARWALHSGPPLLLFIAQVALGLEGWESTSPEWFEQKSYWNLLMAILFYAYFSLIFFHEWVWNFVLLTHKDQMAFLLSLYLIFVLFFHIFYLFVSLCCIQCHFFRTTFQFINFLIQYLVYVFLISPNHFSFL